MLDVRFLGEQRVVADPEGCAASARAVELLAYLVANAGIPQQRRLLARVLWPDSEESQARTNLRRELHNLRVAIGDDPSLDVQSSTLTWRDRSTCHVDVRTFESERRDAAAAGAAGDRDAWLSHAEAALAEYRGEFMPGTIDDWVLETRAALLQECVDLCDDVVDAHRASGAVHRALEFARRRVALMPLEETGHRTLMTVQIEAGDRAAAMVTYERCAAMLDREFGVEPDPETTAIFDSLIRPRASDGGRSGARSPWLNDTTAGAAFVGRATELDRLIGQWRAADAGERTAVVVYGEPGVGKSRLVAELAAFAASEGAVVATSRCFGQSGRLALAPVADWLRCGEVRAGAATLDPVWQTEVDRLVPREDTGTPDPASADRAGRIQPEVDALSRLRFFEGLARAILHAERPILLVLDDLQWCDEATISWLVFLLEFSEDARLMVAATARPDAMGDSHGVATAVRRLASTGLLHEVGLAPLGSEESAVLAARLMGRPLSGPDEEILFAATGGYPLFIVEAARSDTPAHDADGSVRTTDVQAVLRRRLEETSPEAQDVARLAAAVGRDFTLDLLEEASDLDPVALVDAVDELWRCQILVEHRGGYDFSHDLLRDAAYASVSSARRWLLHRRLAQGIELLHSGHLDAVAAQLADQYLRGGRPDRALPYYRRAADAASSIYANAEAIRQHDRCLELIAQLPEGLDRDAQELEVRQAMAAPLNAHRGYAAPVLQATLERSIALAERLGRPDVLVRNLVGLFGVRFVQGYTAEAHEFSTRALALSAGDPELAGEAHFAFAGSASSLGMFHLAVEHFGIAAEMTPDTVPLVVGTRPEIHAQAWSAHPLWLLGHDDAAVAHAADAVSRGRAARQPYNLAVALAYACITDQLRDDEPSLRRDAIELRGLCSRHEFAYYGEWGLILEGWATKGDRGIAKIRLGIRSLRSQGAYARMPYWLSLLAETLADAGATDQATAVLDAALVAAEQRDDRWWLPEVLRQRASLADGHDAARYLDRALTVADGQSSATLARRCEADLAALGVRDARPHGERLANA